MTRSGETTPMCVAGDDCGARTFLAEVESVHYLLERRLVLECAALRARVTELEIDLVAFRNPEEERADGRLVRKDRWEMGMRRIADLFVDSRSEFEIDVIVERVRELAATRTT